MRKILNEDLGRVTPEEFKSAKKSPIIIIADNVRSLNNIGSLFRTGDAFAVYKIYLCGITATPPNREIHKTALGAELTVEWEYFENTIDAVEKARNEGFQIMAVEQVENSIMLDKFEYSYEFAGCAIVLGNEVNGVDQNIVNICDGAIEIPQYGTKHSLNVSVACGVVVWTIFSLFKNNK